MILNNNKKKILSISIIIIIAIITAVLYSGKNDPILISPAIEIGEEVGFMSKDITITGSLIKPETETDKRLPAIIMVVGSSSYSYRSSWETDNFPFWKIITETFVDKGFAVLLLEKRGINAAKGNWKKASFSDRAEDVYSAVKYLQSRDDILSDKISLCGHSQGGWIVQLVASEYPDDIDSIVNLAGPSISVKEQIIDDEANAWLCEGLGSEEIEKKRKWLNTKLSIYASFSKFIKIGYIGRIINYDPKDIIPKIKCPTLSIYGENDYLVLAEKNAELLEEGLKKGGNNNYEIVVVPQANHGFRVSGKCYKSTDLENSFAPGFIDALDSWEYPDSQESPEIENEYPTEEM